MCCMKRIGAFPFLVALCTSLVCSAAHAASFGALNVIPHGSQSYDLETGVTKMPQGGTVTQAKHGLSMTASKIEMKANDRLSAWNATLKTKAGSVLVASKLTYLLQQGQVVASGVSYSDGSIKQLKTNALTLYLSDQVLVASGQVSMAHPAMNAVQLVVDVKTRRSLIVGPYQVAVQSTAVTGEAGQKRILGLKKLRLEPFTADNPEGQRLAQYLK